MFREKLMQGIFIFSGFFSIGSNANSGDVHNGPFSYGMYLKAGSYTVDDPSGDTAVTPAIVPGLKVNFDMAERGERLNVAFEYTTFDLDGSTSEIGQDISGYSFAGGYEKKFAISRNFKIWLGAAVTLSNYEYTDRYTLAGDGFLNNTFENRSESSLGATLTADSFFTVGESGNWYMGVGAYIDSGFSDAVQSVGLKITLQR